MIRTLPAAQKPLVLRRFCSAYSKNRTKARAAKSEQNGTSHGIRPEPEPPASRRSFLPVFRPCLDPSRQSFIGRVFAFVLSRPHSRSAASPYKPAFRPAASRPHDPASITRNTTIFCTKTSPFICAIFQSKNTCISGYCVVQYRQLREVTQKQAFPKVKRQ